jgi:hypothetical protein
MNGKLAKHLRRTVRNNLGGDRDTEYALHPRNRTRKVMAPNQIILHPSCARAQYQQLKRIVKHEHTRPAKSE